MIEGTVTERSFYPILVDVINATGGSGVTEVKYESAPDAIFGLGGRDWILSVKVGESIAGIKAATLQYLRHKEESNIPYGILLMLPENARRVPVKQEELEAYIQKQVVTVLLDAGEIKQELATLTFPQIMKYIRDTVLPKIANDEKAYFSLKFVVGLLQQHVQEMMNEIKLNQEQILRIVVNKKLLINIGHMAPEQAEAVGRFLSSYILLSQILFLRLFYTAGMCQ